MRIDTKQGLGNPPIRSATSISQQHHGESFILGHWSLRYRLFLADQRRSSDFRIPWCQLAILIDEDVRASEW
jgi:hypothetical protein